jgi:hypothetical protein
VTDKTATIEEIAARFTARRALMSPDLMDAEYEALLLAEEADIQTMAAMPTVCDADQKTKVAALRAGSLFKHGMANGPDPGERALLHANVIDLVR